MLGHYVEDGAAPEAGQAAYNDIKETRGVDWINDLWKAFANDPQP